MLAIDFETRSTQILGGSRSVGAYNYASHPETEILMLSWAIDNGPVEVWEPRFGEIPGALMAQLQDPNNEIVAFNSTFERYILKFKLGIEIPVERFQDPQPSARYLSLPGSLDACSGILGLSKDQAKDKEGKRLIHLFCEPHKTRKKKGEEQRIVFYDWDSHPEDWAQFVEYCRQDVVAEREVLRREKMLRVWPLPPLERKIWEFDQKVNDRGMPVNRAFVTNALALADREKKEMIANNNKLTGLDNSNSPLQLLEWAQDRGYRGINEKGEYSLDKDSVTKELKSNKDLDPLCIEVLENRKAAASTSYKKMAAILRQVNKDDRLRGQFIYMGSSRCGRWSGNAVQLHNMARPNAVFEEEENIDLARALIYALDYEGIKESFKDPKTGKLGSVLETVKFNIRTAFEVKPGNRFNVSDLNAIETRVGAWVAECEPLLYGFRSIHDFDPYLDFGMKMTQIPYEILKRDYKSKDKALKAAAKAIRQIAKPGVLGCIYRMGALALMAYAEGMGVIMTLKQAEDVVKIFREAYKEIVQMWFRLEEAISDVMEEGTVRVKRNLGPDGCIEISKFLFTCNGHPRTILEIKLPSGRSLHYVDASIQSTKMPWQDRAGNDVYRDTLCYATQDQETKQWGSVTTHGGKVFENIVQAIARDVLAVKMLLFDDEKYSIVGHVHDEILIEGENSPFDIGAADMDFMMAQPVEWAPGLPLAAGSFESLYYHK